MTLKNEPASCGSCGMTACGRNVEKAFASLKTGGRAWLLDETSPEFQKFLSETARPADDIFVPFGNKLFKRPGYTWDLPCSSHVKSAVVAAAKRALALRRLRGGGGRRQDVVQRYDQIIADVYGKNIGAHVTALTVSQNFLPFLHLNKTLGGRSYDVLLSRSPLDILECTLDRAARQYPGSPTLADFRSAPHIVDAEREALAGAKQIITAHHHLAKIYPEKTTVLPWVSPKPLQRGDRTNIAFLGPTVGRRGAYLVREAIRQLNIPLIVIGKNLESENFWEKMDTRHVSFDVASLQGTALLIAPSLTEIKPSLLLQALSEGFNVIATEACGLPPQEGLELIAPDDVGALITAIQTFRHRVGADPT